MKPRVFFLVSLLCWAASLVASYAIATITAQLR
jgi:hypothetical protein